MRASSALRLAATAMAVALATSSCGTPSAARAPAPAPTAAPVSTAPVEPATPVEPAAAAATTDPPELRDFDFVVDCMTRNYAGYPDKVPGHEQELADLTRRTREAIVADPTTAPAQIRGWLGWFHDQHVGLEEQVTAPAPAAPLDQAAVDRALAAEGERVEVSPAELRAAGKARRGRDPYVGLWETADGMYRVLVQRPDPRVARWRGVLVATTAPSWSPGQIKLRIAVDDGRATGTFAFRNHRESTGPVTVMAGGDLLRFDAAYTGFRRVGTKLDVDRFLPSGQFFLRPLSATTLWLRVPSFRPQYRQVIEELLTKNQALLERTPNLVIDLRLNDGGSDWSYQALMGWLYTRPIYQLGVQWRVSADNARALEAYLTPDMPADERQVVETLVTRMREAKGEWMSFSDGRSFDITVYPQVRPSPAHVGILIDGAGSSGEQFVADARSSHKVTLFGRENTAGVLDYSNVLQATLPSGRYVLRYSGTRSLRLPEERFDNVGLAPDVRLGDEVDDPIGYIQRWLEARSAAEAAAR